MDSAWGGLDAGRAVLSLLIGYGLGSIPFGVLVTRALNLGDLRKIGSGNIGATNVLRTGHKGAAAATLLLDGFKGALAVWILGALWGPTAAAIGALAALAGHCWPVWLKFRGGKGVATFLGALLALAPWAGVAACALWLVCAFAFKISSLAALVAVAATPVLAALTGAPTSAVLAVALMAVIVVARHHENIRRLLKGEEPKIRLKREAP